MNCWVVSHSSRLQFPCRLPSSCRSPCKSQTRHDPDNHALDPDLLELWSGRIDPRWDDSRAQECCKWLLRSVQEPIFVVCRPSQLSYLMTLSRSNYWGFIVCLRNAIRYSFRANLFRENEGIWVFCFGCSVSNPSVKLIIIWLYYMHNITWVIDWANTELPDNYAVVAVVLFTLVACSDSSTNTGSYFTT